MALWVYDPGQTTGYAKFNSRGYLEEYGELVLWRGIDRQIRSGDTVVYEDIKVLHLSFNPIGLQVIGALRYIVEERGQIRLTPHSPSRLYGVKKWPIFDLSSIRSDHIRDAIYHGIVALGQNNVILPKKFYKNSSTGTP